MAVKITSEALLQRLVDDIKADLADLFDESGGLKAVGKWPPSWRTGLVSYFDIREKFATGPNGEKSW